MAAAHLHDALGDECFAFDLPCWRAVNVTTLNVVRQTLKRPALLTSSCGPMFDAVASICGVTQSISYEGEAAILLESRAAPGDCGRYPFDLASMFRQIAHEMLRGRPVAQIPRCFHDTVADIIGSVCNKVRGETGSNAISKTRFTSR